MLPFSASALVMSLLALPTDSTPTVELAPLIIERARFPELASNTPGSFDFIDLNSAAVPVEGSLADILAREANVPFRSFTGNTTEADIALRGFGAVGTQRTLVLLDGMKLNPVDIDGINWLQLPPTMIQSVEVLRGAQTALYGNHAVGGVIKITTRSPSDRSTATIDAVTGGEGYEARTLFGAGSMGEFTGSIVADLRRDQGWRANSGSTAQTVSARAQWAREGLSAGFLAAWSETEADRPGSLADDELARDPRGSLFDADFESQVSRSLQGRLTWEVAEPLEIRVNGGFSEVDTAYFLTPTAGDNRLRSAAASPRLRWAHGGGRTIMGIDAGLDRFDVQIFRSRTRGAVAIDTELERRNLAAYVHEELVLAAGRVRLSAGARLERSRFTFEQTDFGQLAGQQPKYSSGEKDETGWAWTGGLVVRPAEQSRVWLRYDRLYRYPATDEILTYQGFALLEPFNRDLDPERGHNLELGTGWRVGEVEASFNLFAQWLEGEIDFYNNLNRNLPPTRRRGVEVSTSWAHTWVEAGLDYTYLDAEITGEPPPGVPPERSLVPEHLVSARLGLRPHPAVRLDAYLRYQSSATVNYPPGGPPVPSDQLPAYALVDLRLSLGPWRGLTLFAAVDNLLDRRYLTAREQGGNYPGSGRRWRAGASFTY